VAISRRAFVMVWDGMRPDFVRPDLTPNLWRLGQEGVRFSNSHAVFPTVTRVNSACIATGALPSSHGIVNNAFYLPAAEPARPLDTGNDQDLQRLRAVRGGRILLMPSLAEAVHAAGGRTVVAGTGSPGSSLLLHPEADACQDFVLNPSLFVGADRGKLERAFGPPPERSLPRTALNAHFTRLITDYALPELRPDLFYFWHTDPDATIHARGIGHADSLEAIRDADRNLGSVLEALARLGQRDSTDVMVTSDHGFSTVQQSQPIIEALMASGLKASRESLDVVLTGGFVYVREDVAARVEAIVGCLAGLDATGAIFTGAKGPVLPGTLPMAALGIASEIAPDIVWSAGWNDDLNEFGVPGMVMAIGGKAASHGSLSRWEVRNTLIAAGPGFKSGRVSDVPAATIDIAPTLAHLMGIDGLKGNGRVLIEALEDGRAAPTVRRRTVEAEAGAFRQALEISEVDGYQYVDAAGRARV
jgi:hypothetical protein